jgi:hypothetical protein
MPFVDIARALFPFSPQLPDDLFMEINDFLYVLDKGHCDWWKAKRKGHGSDDRQGIVFFGRFNSRDF